ncbi:MAG TPA: hypothetical protein VLP30_06750, partial [Desulfatirhabdiaceae bacterium]|nr:hypothetical protein [Desulfatirhabdiaceae bacterium]
SSLFLEKPPNIPLQIVTTQVFRIQESEFRIARRIASSNKQQAQTDGLSAKPPGLQTSLMGPSF